MSTHEVRVYKIDAIEKHPNADRLGLVHIEGFTAIVRLGDFKPGDLAAYIEPDYVVPDNERFAFLKGRTRIRSQKLRGVWSQGLLIHAPRDSREGDNVMHLLGITRYEPPTKYASNKIGRGNGSKTGSSTAEKPHATLEGIGVYDLENWRKHSHAFEPGEHVLITEKIHGCNARYAWRAGRMWAGSRTQWRRSGELTRLQKLWTRIVRFFKRSQRPNTDIDMGNVWWRVLKTHHWIESWCKANPDCVLYGEIFGDVQDLKYGAKEDELFFLAFDVLRAGKWVDAHEFCELVPAEFRVPVLFIGPYCPVKTEELSRLEKSTLADHLSEGIVIRPITERYDPRVGRVALKLVSDAYLERAK